MEEESMKAIGKPFKSCWSDVNYTMGFEDGVKWANERPLSSKINKEIKNNKTMITRENVKELLPIFKAYAEGKTIEVKNFKGEWLECDEPYFDSSPGNYRIKEIKYRPFKSQKECWEEMHKHPDFGWVLDNVGEYVNLSRIVSEGIYFTKGGGFDFSKALKGLRFTDCVPFGIKEE